MEARFAMAHAVPPRPRPVTEAESMLLEQIAALEAKAVLAERLSATLNRDPAEVRGTLTQGEVAAFTGRWNSHLFDTCLRAGVTVHEFKRALRTGELPDVGLVQALASLRHPDDPR